QVALEHKAMGKWTEATEILLQHKELLELSTTERWAQKAHMVASFELAVVMLYRRLHRNAEHLINVVESKMKELRVSKSAGLSVLHLRSLVCQYELRWADAERFSQEALERYMTLDPAHVRTLSCMLELALIRVQL